MSKPTEDPESYDVYVSDDVLLEVHRGENMTVVQPFGVDWNGELPAVRVHDLAFKGLPIQEDQKKRPMRASKRALFALAVFVMGLAALWFAWPR